MDPLELGIPALFIIANVLVIAYAVRARMKVELFFFYAVLVAMVALLPAGVYRWLPVAILTAAAVCSGRQLVKMQDRELAR